MNIIKVEGMSFNDEGKVFSFAPDDPVMGRVEKFVCYGMGQRLSDGSFEFVARPRVKTKSNLVKRFTHGRLSITADDALQLTLKVFNNEGNDPFGILSDEIKGVQKFLKNRDDEK